MQGKRLLRHWQDFLARLEGRGQVVFVENYDLIVAAHLTHRVDV